MRDVRVSLRCCPLSKRRCQSLSKITVKTSKRRCRGKVRSSYLHPGGVNEERIEMSQQERDRLHWLKLTRDKKITQKKAAERMGVSARWVRQLLRKLKRKGDGVVVHGLRKRPSNRKIAESVQRRAIELVRSEYGD